MSKLIDPGEAYAAGNSGPGWPLPEPDEDNRPAYAPAALVFEVIDILARAGISVDAMASRLYVAELSAADLLRALGVAPQRAPEQRSAR